MEHPQNILTILEKSTYRVPTYQVTNEGLSDAGSVILEFCKGNKADELVPRQPGFFTETLVATCIQYLEENNVGELASAETTLAIRKFQEGLMWLGKRAEDRKKRGVQGTYQK